MSAATKTVSTWHVTYALRLCDRWIPHVAVFRDPGEAAQAAKMRDDDKNYACVETSGPHEHRVPE